MRSRRSILSRVMYINLTMAAVITVIFLVSSVIYSNQLTRERYHLANTKLSKLNKDFQIEMQRLDAFLTLCIHDSSLVYTLSDRLGMKFFKNNSDNASAKLSLIRQSLPYAKTVFLYTKTSQRIVPDNGHLYTENDFLNVVLNKNTADKITSIESFSDGLHQYSDSYALYVKNLYSHGYIAVQINLSEFANINKNIDDDFFGYVIGKDGKCLIGNSQFRLGHDEIRTALKNDFISLNSTKYYCASSDMRILPYTGLVLVNNDALMSPLYYMYTVMGITFAILFTSSLLLVLLNYKIYLPLKKFTSQFSNSDDNEISILEDQIHELLFEINILTKDAKNSGLIPEKIALHYLLSSNAELDENTLKILEKKYPYYTLMALTVQNTEGLEDISFVAALEKDLSEKFELKFINIDKCVFALVTKSENKEEIISVLKAAAENTDKNIEIFVGTREYCTSIRDLNTNYKLAEETMLNSVIIKGGCFSCAENTSLPNKKVRLLSDKQSALFEYARNNASELILRELEQIFYPETPLTLESFRSFYFEVLAIFEKACLAKKVEPVFLSNENIPYNTEYMYRNLCSLNCRLFSESCEQQYDIKSRMEEYISKHLKEPLTLSTVADIFSITPVYLSSWFKKNMGVNFSSYIAAARMERAIKLLCKQNSPKIHEIAAEVGIDSTATFIRQFKKHTGTTPSQYQKNWTDK